MKGKKMKLHTYLPMILLISIFIISYPLTAGSGATDNDGVIIAITSTGTSLESTVSQNFGRCPYLLFYDCKDETLTVLENPGVELRSGAGRNAAELVINSGATYLVTGNIGDRLEPRLKNAGIQIVTGLQKSVTIKDAIEMIRSGY